MFTLTSFRSLSRSSTILSSTGETAWHGPHHSAQKSTITGLSLWRTSCSKLDSVTAVLIFKCSFPLSLLVETPVVESLFPRLDWRDGADLQAAAARSRPSSARGGDSAVVGGRTSIPAASREKPWRPEVPVHGRADHCERPGRRAPRPRSDAERRLPAVQGAPRPRPPLPERLRLAGPPRRGTGGEGPRAELEARDRGVRDRRVRPALPRVRRALRRHPDRAVEAARDVDGLGELVLHLQRHEHRVHLAVPQERPRTWLALQGASFDPVVPALRHVALEARAGRRRELRGAGASVALRSLPARRARGRGARHLDDDAVDAAGERRRGGESRRDVRAEREWRLGVGRRLPRRQLCRAPARRGARRPPLSRPVR